MLDRFLTSLGLTISHNKSMVVASHPQLLRAVRRELLEQGISFERTDSVGDVGLDANAGNKRSVKIHNKREQKCCKRNAHIKVMQKELKTKRQAMKLFKTVILPATSYGHAAMGMCPSSIQHWRAMAADSCGKRIKTACTTQSYTSILERAEIQLSGFHSISFALGSNSKARIWSTDLGRLTSPVHRLPLLPI